MWFRGEVIYRTALARAASGSYLRGSRQKNADRRKEPAKPFFFKEKTHENLQRKTR